MRNLFLAITILLAAAVPASSQTSAVVAPRIYSSVALWVGGKAGSWSGFGGSARRILLTAPTTYYVSETSGSDANDCSTTTTPCATISRIYGMLQAGVDLGGNVVTVQALSNLTQQVNLNGPLVGIGSAHNFVILGNAANPSAVSWSNPAGGQLITAADDAHFSVKGFTIHAGGFGVVVSSGTIYVNNVNFTGMGGAALDTAGSRSVIGGADLSFSGSYQSGWVAEDNSFIVMSGTITFNGANFSNAVEQADLGGMIDRTGGSASGSVSGASSHAYSNGVIQSNGWNLPGSGVSTGGGGSYN